MSPRKGHSPAARAKHRERVLVRRAIAALILFAVVVYAAWVKHLPFGHPYEIRAVFSSSNQLRPGNPVRIDGIDVGTVSGIAAGPRNTALVTMQVADNGRPIHDDATLQIEPRLLLEGNFYVALQPGSPSAPILASGGTVGPTQTSTPVQLDQLLDVFNGPIRGSLQSGFRQFAIGLGPAGGSRSGAGGFRQADRELDGALNSVTQVEQAARGTQPGDLARMVASTGATTDELSRDPGALAGLVTNTDRVTAALAANDGALEAGVRKLDGVLIEAPHALSALDRALPVLSRFAVVLQPALTAAPAPLRKAEALLGELTSLASAPELPRLLTELAPVLTTLPGFEHRLGSLFPWVTPVSSCVATHLVPVLDSKLNDGALSTGRPVWQDLVHSFVGVASANPDFDANGKSIRLTTTLGDQSLDAVLPGVGQLIAANAPSIEGTDPVWLGPGVSPPWRPDQPCATQALPNLSLRRAGGLPAGMHSSAMPATTAPSPATIRNLLKTVLADQRRVRSGL